MWCLYTWSYLDILIIMLNSVNCSTVICSPTVEYLCSWEKPLVKPMAPGSILIISISITLLLALFLLCLLLFTLHQYTKNIIYHLYQISLPQVTVKGWTTPKRVGCVELFFLCRYEGLARSLLLDWDLGSQKLREILTLLCCIIPSSSGKTNAVLKR